MQADVPASVAFVRPLVSRFNEIRNVEPIVAYFCLMLAVKQVLDSKLHTSDATVAEFATDLMNTIEGMKNDKSMLDNESSRTILDTDDASQDYVLNFANSIFERAEMATVTRKVNKTTAASFAAAAVFLGLEAVWSPVSPETTEKIKFAKFQAARILRAIKAGEDPNKLYETELETELTNEQEIEQDTQQNDDAGQNIDTSLAAPDADGNAEDEDDNIKLPEAPKDDPERDISLPQAPEADPGNDISLPPAPNSAPQGNVSPPAPPAKPAKPAVPARPQTKPAAPKAPTQQPSSVQSTSTQTPAQIIALTRSTGDAQKHAKYAISALNYDDVRTAISQLEQALDILKNIQ